MIEDWRERHTGTMVAAQSREGANPEALTPPAFRSRATAVEDASSTRLVNLTDAEARPAADAVLVPRTGSAGCSHDGERSASASGPRRCGELLSGDRLGAAEAEQVPSPGTSRWHRTIRGWLEAAVRVGDLDVHSRARPLASKSSAGRPATSRALTAKASTPRSLPRRRLTLSSLPLAASADRELLHLGRGHRELGHRAAERPRGARPPHRRDRHPRSTDAH